MVKRSLSLTSAILNYFGVGDVMAIIVSDYFDLTYFVRPEKLLFWLPFYH
jgi:hypothetical protein